MATTINVSHGMIWASIEAHRKQASIQQALIDYANRPFKQTPSMVYGNAAHAFLIGNTKTFSKEFAVGGPMNEKTGKPYGYKTKKWAEWLQNEHPDKGQDVKRDVISMQDFQKLCETKKNLQKNKAWNQLNESGKAEFGVITDVFGLRTSIRYDWVSDRLKATQRQAFYDLKTSSRFDSFVYAMRSYGYVHQMALYQHAALQKGLERFDPFLVAVENRDACRCAVFKLKPKDIELALNEIKTVSGDIKQALERIADGQLENTQSQEEEETINNTQA